MKKRKNKLYFLIILTCLFITQSINSNINYRLISQHKIAKVRLGNEVCLQEKLFLDGRKSIVQKAIQSTLNIRLEKNNIPNIAFCFSGGGNRAMISTLATLIGAKKINLLDCVAYNVGLSGSSWTLTSWLNSQLDLARYKQKLQNNAQSTIIADLVNKDFIKQTLKLYSEKYTYKKKFSVIDIYGQFLTQKYLDNNSDISLYQTRNYLDHTKQPFPISTAANSTNNNYKWFEFTPFEVGSNELNAYIPTWSFGRTFLNNYSTNFTPEEPLGFLLGVFGSAFASDFKKIIDNAKYYYKIFDYFDLSKLVQNKNGYFSSERLTAAIIPNFTYGIPNQKLTQQKSLFFVDAGIDFNLPVPPLLKQERNIDIIFICDFSACTAGIELQKAEEYAKKHNLKFPKIDYKDIDKKIISIFKDDSDKTVPTIIYMPMIKNEKYSKKFDPQKELTGYCSTFNFTYTEQQFNELFGLFEFNIIDNKDMIFKTIKDVIKKKQSNNTPWYKQTVLNLVEKINT